MEALYRKYRPTTFSDVVGQEHIERTLKNAIEQGKVSHAYLFCGPRGTGKTTMARILAKALLCEKGPTAEPDGTCSECEAIARGNHPDVYELDAASRTGVDNIREEVISRVHYAPTRGAWKVYIIDEVHMLSPAAFNALLKTLEEPPSHVVFILCTTDPQQVPETIHSRCQRFDFHRISAESIVSRLGAICVKEGVDFEGEALDLIAYRADGGMRNALTSLEQLMAFGDGHVTLEGAQNLLGSLDETDLSEIIFAIGKRDVAACFNWVARYVETGADLAQFVRDMAEHVRNLYLLSMAGIEVEIPVSEATRKTMVDQLQFFGQDRLSRLLMVLGDLSKELRTASNPRLSFEIALTRMVRPESDITIEALAERVEELEKKLAAAPSAVPVAENASAAPHVNTPFMSAAPVAEAAPAASSASAAEVVPEVSVPNTAAAQVAPSTPAVNTSVNTTAPAPSAPTASVDLSNPAAVQRLWHSVTTSLRKVNPARGVLFMNAKVSSEANGSGLVIEFAKDNGFAYTAAQKPEVQQLLAQTLESVAGGRIAYRLSLEGGAPGAPLQGASQQITSPQSASAAQQVSAAQSASPQAQQPAMQQSSQPASQAERVRVAVAAAAARASQAAASQSAAVQLAPTMQSAPATKSVATPASSPANAFSQSGCAGFAQPAQPTPVQPRPASAQPAPMQTAPVSAPDPVLDDDQVPLEAYGDAFSSDEALFDDPSPVATAPVSSGFAAAQPVSSAPAVSSPVPMATASVSNGPVAVPGAASSTQQSAPQSQAVGSVTSIDPSGDEATQIKQILSNSFGDGIKFEELSD